MSESRESPSSSSGAGVPASAGGASMASPSPLYSQPGSTPASSAAIMAPPHSPMTPQVQMIQQPLGANPAYLQQLYTASQQPMLLPAGNLTLHPGLSLQLQAKPAQTDPTKAAAAFHIPASHIPTGVTYTTTPNLMSASQVIGSKMPPGQMIAAASKSTMIQTGQPFVPATSSQTVVIGQLVSQPAAQLLPPNSSSTGANQGKPPDKPKPFQLMNQQGALQPKSPSILPSSTGQPQQQLKASHLQPTMIASQAQILQALGASLPPGITWATPTGAFLTTANNPPIFIRSQQSDMVIQSQPSMHAVPLVPPPPTPQPSRPSTPHQQPPAQPVPASTPQTVSQQRPKLVRPASSVATQTAVSSSSLNGHQSPRNSQNKKNRGISTPPGSNNGSGTPPTMAHMETQTSSPLQQRATTSTPDGSPTVVSTSTVSHHSDSARDQETSTREKESSLDMAEKPLTADQDDHPVDVETREEEEHATETSHSQTQASEMAEEITQPSPVEVKEPSPPPQSPLLSAQPPLSAAEKPHPQRAIVKPHVLTHVIEGYVIHEAPEPFPVNRCPPPSSEPTPMEEKPENDASSHHHHHHHHPHHSKEKKEKLKSTLNNDEMARCQLCGKVGARSKFKRSKRFCSTSCAKRYEDSPSPPGAPAPNSHSGQATQGIGRPKKKIGFKARKNWKKAKSGRLTYSVPEWQMEAVVSSPGEEEDKGGETTDSPSGPESSLSPPDMAMDVDPPQQEVSEPPPSSTTNPLKWSVNEVAEFVRELPGCSDYAEEFRQQEIDGQALLLLKEEHLMSAMSMKLGPALKVCARIQSLRGDLTSDSSQRP